MNDVAERTHVETGASDERAVDVGLGAQCGDVVRLDAAAVQDVAALGGVRAEPLAQARADVGVGVLRLFGRGVLTRADGPHGLVGEHEIAQLFRRDAVEPLLHLPIEHVERLIRHSLLQRLADADDRHQLRAKRRDELAVDAEIRLAEERSGVRSGR